MNATVKPLRVNSIVASFPTEWDAKSVRDAYRQVAGQYVHGTVRICDKVISLFRYALSTDNSDAWNILLILYRDTAYKQACSRLSEEEAEEVAQEVLVRLWANRLTLRPSTNLGGWVRVMAKNAATDLMRRRRTWEEGIDAAILAVEQADAEPGADITEEYNFVEAMDLDTPEGILEAEQALEILCAASDKLPRTVQLVLSLLGDGDSYDTIAWKLGIGPDAARAMASRGKQVLLQHLHMKTKSKQ